MRYRARGTLLLVMISLVLFAMMSCAPSEESAERVNPLLTEWDTPFGVPPYDRIQEADYLPAFRAAIDEENAEIQAIVDDPEPATFDNTIVALERAGKQLNRVSNAFFPVRSANSNEQIRAIAEEIAPELAAHSDDILLNADLYARVKEVWELCDTLELTPEQYKLAEETNKAFVRAGVGLPADAQARLREINAELARLSQTFSRHLLAETNDFELHVTDEADLGELPASLKAAAAQLALDRGYDGGWLFTLQRPSLNPFLQYSPARELRRQGFDGYLMRGDRDNDNDNKAVAAREAALRAERAELMGFPTHAAYVLDDSMAKTPEAVYELLDQIWEPALRVTEGDRDAFRAMMNEDGIPGELMGWDWRYYEEKVRRARYDFDEAATRPYFEVNAVRDGAFMVANRLYGLTFRPLDGIPTWHPDQQVFEVMEADGSHLGVLYMDFFARESKEGGAWMNTLRSQQHLDGDVTPIVTTNFNFPPPSGDSPSLLSFTEAQTLFHEFGHALHGLLSDVTYRSLSGTHVPRDFVEFPSQVMENWMADPEVLRMYARHYETGEVIPDELVGKIEAASTFGQGFITTEYLAAAYLDMAYHTLTAPEEVEPRAFEAAEMERIGLIPQIPPRYRTGYFSHIFAGGYSAGYYSYIWAEVLDKDAFQAFKETGDVFDPETAARLRMLLSQGGSRPGMELYEEFRGRPPEITPLLEARGLAGGD
jgi:peptidyl-dipeptidase Dcp